MDLFSYFYNYDTSKSPLATETYEIVNNYMVNNIRVYDKGYYLSIDACCVNEYGSVYGAWGYNVEKENIDVDVLDALEACDKALGGYVDLYDWD